MSSWKKQNLNGKNITKDQGQLTAVAREDKQEVHMLTNMNQPSDEGKFQRRQESALKPSTIKHNNKHTQNVDQSDRMAKCYLMSQCTFKTMTTFFPLAET
jgi:hypothetical protein